MKIGIILSSIIDNKLFYFALFQIKENQNYSIYVKKKKLQQSAISNSRIYAVSLFAAIRIGKKNS